MIAWLATKLFGGSTISAYLAVALVIVVVISGGLLKYALSEIEAKSSLITALQISNDAQAKAIKQIQADTKNIQIINESLTVIERANAETAANLADKLAKLDKAALENPSLVEVLINKASDERVRCIALVTGAPKTKKEQNSICPQVIERK